jgi:hypothetical protein
LSAKLNLDPDHKDSLEALQLLDRMAKTLRLYHRSKARLQERRQTLAAKRAELEQKKNASLN